MPDPSDDEDVTRRTLLAAERTWLAWWRSGIAAATAAVAVGGVVPHLVESSRTPYVVLGAGYAVLAAAVFVGAHLRRQQLERALGAGRYEPASDTGLLLLTAFGLGLAVGTLAVVIAQG